MLKGWDKNIFFYQVGSYKKRKPLPLLPLFQSIFKLSQCWLLLILWSHHSLHSVSNTDTLEVFLLWKKTPTNIPNSAYSNSCWRRTVICPALIILLLCFIVFCLKKCWIYSCIIAGLHLPQESFSMPVDPWRCLLVKMSLGDSVLKQSVISTASCHCPLGNMSRFFSKHQVVMIFGNR